MKSLTLTLLGLLASATQLPGAVIFLSGNDPQTDENVLFHDSCVGCIHGPANTVIGHLQQSGLLVDLSSPAILAAVGPGHNTVSTENDAGFTAMSIRVEDMLFRTIILQLTALGTSPAGTVVFTAHTNEGLVSATLPMSHTGGNYFTIVANAGTYISQLDFVTTELQHDISQIRIGGAVPEPGTAALLGLALLLLGSAGRRRRA